MKFVKPQSNLQVETKTYEAKELLHHNLSLVLREDRILAVHSEKK